MGKKTGKQLTSKQKQPTNPC